MGPAAGQESSSTVQEIGHIRTDPGSQRRQIGRREAEIPDPVERHKAGCRVAAPSPETGAGGDPLLEADVGAPRCGPIERGEKLRCLPDQVGVIRRDSRVG